MKSPFPWFGGKSRVAEIVWERFGDTPNYVEPFFGSGAVLLARPHAPRCETVNDKDCFVANFWRCFTELSRNADSPAWEAVAEFADGPVNEADLHARHLWLVKNTEFQERMKTDPDYFDPKVAGWWVWGISQWIGGGWCTQSKVTDRTRPATTSNGVHRNMDRTERRRPELSSTGSGIHKKRMRLARSGAGVHRGDFEVSDRIPDVQRPKGVHRQMPDLRGDSGAFGKGVHRCGLSGIFDYFEEIAIRMRRVRVCCGDWSRIMGPSPTYHVGVTAVFLDPPYSDKAKRDGDLYACEDLTVAHDVREWAIANGNNPKLRIALCGYQDEHQMPADWEVYRWQANGGYANSFKETEKAVTNASKETIWFSPHCVKEQDLFTR